MNKIEKLNVKLFADGADKSSMLEMYSKSHIKGLTTNPTLMKKLVFLIMKRPKEILETITDKSLSLEVFDELHEMKRQALEITKWAENVCKIPISNTKESTINLIK